MQRTVVIFLLVAQLAGPVLMLRSAAKKMIPAVIVNRDNPVEDLSLSELRKIFSGQRRAWPGGTPVKIVVRGVGTEERAAMLRLLGLTENEYRQWSTQVFGDDASSAPLVMPSFGMVKEAVAAFSGSIAIVDFSMIKPDMKVIKVDDHLPGEADYPLQ